MVVVKILAIVEVGTSNEQFILMGKRYGNLERLDVGELEWLDLGDFNVVAAAMSDSCSLWCCDM
ncbi:conserved hypothetical protein [Ricinus communis]|uniref:Uncharacterized protein n=1 Tax=Ricinus communis TaxID=3988 RepID=B9SL13_RICCO|nr:conserved hypothetical protein [Ricinus communis]